MYMYVCVCGVGLIDRTHIHTYVCPYVCMYMYVCVCGVGLIDRTRIHMSVCMCILGHFNLIMDER